jgi:hypothetical protein
MGDILDLGERIAETAAHLDAATHRLLTDLREFDEKRGWYKAGARDCAQWLSWRVGWSRGTAKQHVLVAQRLGGLPLIDEALRKGEVSYCKVRAMTRVATSQNEWLLLESARLMTGAQLEQVCRKYATVQAASVKRKPCADERFVRRRSQDNGMVKIEAVLHADEAALVWATLDRAAAELAAKPANEGEKIDSAETVARESAAAGKAVFDRADAFVRMAQHFASGDAGAGPAVEVVVTVPVAALANEAPNTFENVGLTANGEALAPETCRRLACDAGIRFLVEDEHGTPLSVGRRMRTLPAALWQALKERDRTCCFPGCQNHLFTHAHHMKHWANGGETKLGNLARLCTHHHRFVHEYGYSVRLDAQGKPELRDPRGRLVLAVPPRIQRPDLGWTSLQAANEDLAISAETNRSSWNGEPIPYHDVVRQLSRADDGAYVAFAPVSAEPAHGDDSVALLS